MSGALLTSLPNKPSWRDAQLKAQGQLYLLLFMLSLLFVGLTVPVSVTSFSSDFFWGGGGWY